MQLSRDIESIYVLAVLAVHQMSAHASSAKGEKGEARVRVEKAFG